MSPEESIRQMLNETKMPVEKPANPEGMIIRTGPKPPKSPNPPEPFIHLPVTDPGPKDVAAYKNRSRIKRPIGENVQMSRLQTIFEAILENLQWAAGEGPLSPRHERLVKLADRINRGEAKVHGTVKAGGIGPEGEDLGPERLEVDRYNPELGAASRRRLSNLLTINRIGTNPEKSAEFPSVKKQKIGGDVIVQRPPLVPRSFGTGYTDVTDNSQEFKGALQSNRQAVNQMVRGRS